MQGFTKTTPPAMVFFSLQHKGDKLFFGHYRMTLKEINRTVRMIDHVNTRIAGLLLDAAFQPSLKELEKDVAPSRGEDLNPTSTDLRPPRRPDLSFRKSGKKGARRYKSPLRGK
jgi:hypothetical protein